LALTITTSNENVLVGEKIDVSLQVKNVSGETLSIVESYYGDEVWLVDGREARLPVPCKREVMPRRTVQPGQAVRYVRHIYWNSNNQLYYTGNEKVSLPLQSPGDHTFKVRVTLGRLIPGKHGVIESNEISISLKKGT